MTAEGQGKSDGNGAPSGARRTVPPTIHDGNTPAPPAGEPPRTIAVALDHDRADDGVPRVVASGHGWVAEQIMALAFANGVKVRQDSDLVQILSAIDIDSDIPPEAFIAVTEILTYVYRANGVMGERLLGETTAKEPK